MFFSFFFSLFRHKKLIELGSTLDKPPKCANHEQFHHTMKKLFLRQFHFVEQCNLVVYMLWPLKYQNRLNNTILYFHIRIFYLCSQNNMVYYAWQHQTPWSNSAVKISYDQETNQLILKWADHFFDWCLLFENGLVYGLPTLLQTKPEFHNLHWWMH